MKLRNKKTGEVIDGGDYLNIYDDVANRSKEWHYISLEELNKEWEDYKPTEPLIKDEKIRKAMKLWAIVNKVKEVVFDEHWHSFRDVDIAIGFLFSFKDFDCLEDGKNYTITELCGEEEE